MPKVGKINVTYNSKDKPDVFDVYYNSTEHFHVKGLLGDFLELTKFIPFGHATEYDLKQAMRIACDKYRELKTNQRKVIVLKVAASTNFTMNQVSDREYKGIKKGISEKIEGFGFGSLQSAIGFEYLICMETKEGNDVKYNRLNSDGSLYGELGWAKLKKATIIPWSEEGEAFFDGMYKAMQEMVYSLSKFIGQDEPAMLAMIQKQGTLALAGKSNLGIVPTVLNGSENAGLQDNG